MHINTKSRMTGNVSLGTKQIENDSVLNYLSFMLYTVPFILTILDIKIL